ncbi:hypothetical protein CPB83DRAFT_885160 [Crepidotus variabilis]|uniref:F-box domain-containing protein n=1 Tax=Crepidotus variabilis TaxID=179855 RepID=A0A9P6EBF0_9AGAR|nr:hypothetical protein CPB83DRAFT_885160 [Crepidotus variabilis]
MSQLPAEIVEEIFTWPQLTLCDLMQCRLVCSDWLSSTSRIGLFRDLTVTNTNADAFASLIINSSSTLPLCIQKLRLHINARWLRRLLPFFQPFQKVTSIALQGLDWTQVDVHSRRNFCQVFKSVKEFSLGPGTTFEELADVIDIVYQLFNLEKLEIDGASWNSYGLPNASLTNDDPRVSYGVLEPHLKPHNLPPTFRHFSANGCCHRDLLLWLISLYPIPQILHVDLGELNPTKTGNIHKFFRVFGEIVQTLSLSFDTTDLQEAGRAEYPSRHLADDVSYQSSSAWNMLEQADISFQCPYAMDPSGPKTMLALHTLRFGNFIYYTEFAYASALSYASGILQWFSITPRRSRIRKIILEVKLEKVADMDRYIVSWALLDRLLANLLAEGQLEDGQDRAAPPVYREGTSLEIFIGGGADREALSALIRSRLGLCERLGLIEIGALSTDVWAKRGYASALKF